MMTDTSERISRELSATRKAWIGPKTPRQGEAGTMPSKKVVEGLEPQLIWTRAELAEATEERAALLDAMRDALACCRDADYALAATVLGNAIRAVGEEVE